MATISVANSLPSQQIKHLIQDVSGSDLISWEITEWQPPTDSIDIFNFVWTSSNSNDTAGRDGYWRALNYSTGYTADRQFTFDPESLGSCCHESYQGGCQDYTTQEDCDDLVGSIFTSSVLCENSACSGNAGACCTMGGCIQSDEEDCLKFGGFFVMDAVCGDGSWSCNN